MLTKPSEISRGNSTNNLLFHNTVAGNFSRVPDFFSINHGTSVSMDRYRKHGKGEHFSRIMLSIFNRCDQNSGGLKLHPAGHV